MRITTTLRYTVPGRDGRYTLVYTPPGYGRYTPPWYIPPPTTPWVYHGAHLHLAHARRYPVVYRVPDNEALGSRRRLITGIRRKEALRTSRVLTRKGDLCAELLLSSRDINVKDWIEHGKPSSIPYVHTRLRRVVIPVFHPISRES